MTKIFGTDDAGKIKAISVDDSGHVRISGSINADLLNVEDVTVRGSDAAGSPPTVPPVAIAGNDGTNVRAIAVTTGGLVKVEISDVTEGPPLLTEGVADPGDDTVALSVKPMLVGGADAGDALRSLLVRADGTLSLPSDSLVPSEYDYISLGYTGDNLTSVVYRLGGVSGTIVSTLTLGYSGSTLVSVEKS